MRLLLALTTVVAVVLSGLTAGRLAELHLDADWNLAHMVGMLPIDVRLSVVAALVCFVTMFCAGHLLFRNDRRALLPISLSAFALFGGLFIEFSVGPIRERGLTVSYDEADLRQAMHLPMSVGELGSSSRRPATVRLLDDGRVAFAFGDFAVPIEGTTARLPGGVTLEVNRWSGFVEVLVDGRSAGRIGRILPAEITAIDVVEQVLAPRIPLRVLTSSEPMPDTVRMALSTPM